MQIAYKHCMACYKVFIYVDHYTRVLFIWLKEDMETTPFRLANVTQTWPRVWKVKQRLCSDPAQPSPIKGAALVLI